ncbi:MAG: hypothetical protein AABX88_01835 [Nanoarchaeota archaeon]
MSRKKTLVVLNDSFEAKQATPYIKNSEIVCLSLEAEYYIKRILPEYENPLHEILLKKFKRGDLSYYSRNFKIAYSWYEEPIFEYVQDSFGYFLTEFDRSLDLATFIIKKFTPEEIIIGKQRGYKGFEVIHGNLDSTAISLIAREKHLPLKFLKNKKEKASVRSIIGKLIAKTRFNFIDHTVRTDLLLVIPGRHLAQMRGLVKQLEKKVSVLPLTYGLDRLTRKELKIYYPNLIEKEHFKVFNFKQESKNQLNRIEKEKDWKNFVHPKYRNRKIISTFLQGSVKRIIEEEFEPIIFDTFLAEKILKTVRPKAILTTTDPDTKVLPYIKTAKMMKIRTLTLQHGASFARIGPIFNPASDYFIAWSEMARLWAKKNVNGERIIAGHSQFHTLKKNVKKISKTKKHKLRILFLSTVNNYEREVPYFLLMLLKALEKQGNKITMTIRTHPSQSLENLTGLFTSKKIKTMWDKSTNLDDAISEADAVIFENTTAGLAAMLAQKPVLYFNPYDGDDYFSIESRGIMTILTDKEIESKISSFFEQRSKWNDFSKKGYKFAIEYLGLTKNKDAKLAKLIINSFQR